MNNQITLIIGAAGNNGLATIEALINKGQTKETICAAVRSTDKTTDLKQKYPSIETVIIDLDKPETLTQIYQGVTKVLMIASNVEQKEQHAKNAVDAAVITAGTVKQFLFYPVFGAEYESILFGK